MRSGIANRIGVGGRACASRRPGSLVMLAAGLAGLLGAVRAAEAATFSGSLPTSATAARLLFLDCSDDGAGAPLSATVQIRDLAPVAAPIASVQLRRGTAATSSSDDVDGDAGASPLVFVNGGSGRYDVFVDKTESGGETFEVSAQCWTGTAGSGAPTGTSLFAAQGGAVPAASGSGQLVLGAGLLLAGALRLAAPRVARASTGRRRDAGDAPAH